jgi:hypothetical protein
VVFPHVLTRKSGLARKVGVYYEERTVEEKGWTREFEGVAFGNSGHPEVINGEQESTGGVFSDPCGSDKLIFVLVSDTLPKPHTVAQWGRY